jgi:4-amino-4-deoxy-L-arabinose transferase-like glycosyltransferase
MKKSGIMFFSAGQNRSSWFFLAIFISLLYLPFMNNRVVRTAGDDKVYVSQALEMAEAGNWFLQTYGNKPNYFKGPAHYIFLRVGMFLFGSSMFATVYMNLIFIILGAIALAALVHRRMKEFEGWSFWIGASFALCAGIYAHAFASKPDGSGARSAFCYWNVSFRSLWSWEG